MKNFPTSNSPILSVFTLLVFLFFTSQKIIAQANSIRSGVTFNWADTQTTLNDPANLQSITINGVDYTTFVVPTSYEMTRLGPGGHSQNNIWMNGTRTISGSNDPNWLTGALGAYQSLNLNHYFQSQNAGDNFCENYAAVPTTNAQIQTITYNPGIPSNPDGVIAITERGGNNCMYIELYGIPSGGGPEQLLGRTFVRNQGNLTGVVPQAPPTANSDYWSSGRNNENNQVIGIALYELSELAPVGSTITSIRYLGATNDHGDGKFFLMQTYAEDDNLQIKLDREGNGDIAANDMVPSGSTYSLITGPSHGTLTFNPDGTFNYIPNPGYSGNDSFQYEVCLPAPNTAVCDTGTAIIIIKLEAIFDNRNVALNSANNRIDILDNDNFGSAGLQPNGAITSYTLPTNGSVALNDNGTPTNSDDDFFTYTPNIGFVGTDFFNYEITDTGGGTDIASVYITITFDTDADTIDNNTDLDDDNDGILDTIEGRECIDNDYFAWEFNSPSGTRTNDFVQNPAITNWLISGTGDIATGPGITAASPNSELQLTDINAVSYAEAITQNEYVETSFTTAAGIMNPKIEQIGINWFQSSGGLSIGNSYEVAMAISKDNFATSILLYTDIQIHYPRNGVSEYFDLTPAGSSFNLEENTTYTLRIYTYKQQNDGNVAYSVFDDFTIRVSACQEQNNDNDSLADHLDLDSDGDGLPDNVEAQTSLGYIAPNTLVNPDGLDTAYPMGLNPVNTDGTDQPDYLDIDTDNEGGNDTTEGGIALSGSDSDNDGLDDGVDENITGYADPGGIIDNPLSAPFTLLDTDGDATSGGDVDFRDATDNRPDNDNDGIVDVDDFDDDNDGILDTDEGCGNLIYNGSFEIDDFTSSSSYTNAGFNGAFIGQPLNSDTLTGWGYTQNLDGWREGGAWADAYHGNQYLDLIGNASLVGNAMNAIGQQITTVPGRTYSLSLRWGEDYGHQPGQTYTLDVDVQDANGASLIKETLTSIAIGPISGVGGPNSWYFYERTFTATTSQTLVQFSSDAPAPNYYSGANIDLVRVEILNAECVDSDGDGVPNAIDLDSDNDGIYDAVEAGHGQPQAGGRVTGTIGTDGVPNSVQDDRNGETVNYLLLDFDVDGLYDAIDLDADFDGIPDNVEAQPSISYVAPSGTVDANGVDTAYSTGLNPVNTDGTDQPDYIDLDADNEGGDDTIEAGISLSGMDNDNDGLDDATDENTSGYADPGGTIDDLLTAPIILPDVDNDVLGGGDVDFRDPTNGLVDIDSDNDGIIDSIEDQNTDGDNDPTTNPTQTDSDGIPDYLDIDSDDDGIPDNVEAQPTTVYMAPGLIDANSNGLDDVYESNGNLGLDPSNSDGADLPDYRDEDSDNDGVPDNIEGNDHDHNGIADVVYIGSDKDNDGLDDGFEGLEQIDVDVNDEIDEPINDLPNADGDQEADYRDIDDDNDGIDTMDEDGNGDGDFSNDDHDNDTTPDYLDADQPEELEELVEVFNVVTPNGDGVHDILTITGLDTRTDNVLRIYSRWGILVYYTESYNTLGNYFDGTSQVRTLGGKEKKLPVGTYFYLLEYKDHDGESKKLSGHLYLN